MTTSHTHQPALYPPNRELKKRMPVHTTSASEKASSNGDINAIYSNAIEVAGHLSSVKGLGVFFGIISSPICIFLLYPFCEELFSGESPYPFFDILFICIIFGYLALIVCFFRMDLFSYRDEPIIFNRATRKIHVFRVRKNIKRPFSPWPLTIDTYDWACAHGEVGGGLVPGKVALLRYKLYLAITDAPDSGTVIDRFFFGSPRNNPDENTWLWEHIRRYMEEGGPALNPGEKLNATTKAFSHREAWAEHLPWLAKDLQQAMKKEGFWFDTFISIIIFPVMFLFSFSTWLAHWTSRKPQWPADIMATLGDPGMPADMPVKVSLAAEPAQPQRSKKKTREARKTIWAITLVAILLIGAKLVQDWMRGY